MSRRVPRTSKYYEIAMGVNHCPKTTKRILKERY